MSDVKVVKSRVIKRLLFVELEIIFVNLRGRFVEFRIVMMILMVLIVISRWVKVVLLCVKFFVMVRGCLCIFGFRKLRMISKDKVSIVEFVVEKLRIK